MFTDNNLGWSNRYWSDAGIGFGWNGNVPTLVEFNATPGEENGTYLTVDERDALLTAAGVPLR
jgi:hypothetical protein